MYMYMYIFSTPRQKHPEGLFLLFTGAATQCMQSLHSRSKSVCPFNKGRTDSRVHTYTPKLVWHPFTKGLPHNQGVQSSSLSFRASAFESQSFSNLQ